MINKIRIKGNKKFDMACQQLAQFLIIFQQVKLNFVLPFSNHDDNSLMSIAAFYAFLFIFGTCGNAAILAVLHHVRSVDCRANNNTTLTYICVLSIVDFISMLPLPMTIIDQVLGFWMFGTFACKLFRLFEHIGKIFSTFILVCFSIDRYCAVCHPTKIYLRDQKTAYIILSFAFCLTCIMLCPILISAQSKEIIIDEKFNPATNELTRLHLFKCVDDLSRELFIIFTLTCFSFVYLVPLLLMIYFYCEMLMKLYEQRRSTSKFLMVSRRNKSVANDAIPLGRIASYTLIICLIHFICWTPYWISVMYSLYLEIFQPFDIEMPDPSFIYLMYGVHALPYVNSASNFILYGLLNRQVNFNGKHFLNLEIKLIGSVSTF
ncbi:unnamed protein product [Dracunculus medinensis]|uniref:G_PROTEIN_RECEP_F1_2 domain-containing protein n=1 Tax=Dracunculus medinensis TaxID=318479 RepID=A0A0N4UE89_DRAME|nr:unnamed protein product [Dracunculus medinensis]